MRLYILLSNYIIGYIVLGVSLLSLFVLSSLLGYYKYKWFIKKKKKNKSSWDSGLVGGMSGGSGGSIILGLILMGIFALLLFPFWLTAKIAATIHYNKICKLAKARLNKELELGNITKEQYDILYERYFGSKKENK